MHTLRSIDILETLAQNPFWNLEYKNFNFNILKIHEIGDQFQLTMKVLLTNENKTKFSVSMLKFYEFWQELRRKYEKRQNYFHNFEHGLNGKKHIMRFNFNIYFKNKSDAWMFHVYRYNFSKIILLRT